MEENISNKYKNFGSITSLQEIIDLCNNSKFDEALPLLENYIEENSGESEAWRLMAQIHWVHLNDVDKAYEELQRSLELDSHNMWALILMGNLLSNGKNDSKGAKEYYDKVLEYYPDNAIAMNNVGATYMKNNDYEKALPFLKKALTIDNSYMNSYYGLGLCYYKLGQLEDSFEICHEGVLKSQDRPENPQVREELMKLYVSVAKDLSNTRDYKKLWQEIKEELQNIDHINIRFEVDKGMNIHAKMEYAPLHKEEEHVIRYNPDKQYVDHLFIHEMMHLKMLQQNTIAHRGKVVIGTDKTRAAFNKKYMNFMRNTHKNVGNAELKKFMMQMSDGLGLQIMNSPLDLFVEHMIYTNYKEARPVQMLSLFHLEQENINSVKKASEAGFFPPEIVRVNKIMNLVSSLHFKELYGVNLIGQYSPTKQELSKAKDLYEEFKAYLDTFKAGDEYELLEYFADSLNVEDLIEIINENDVTDNMKADSSLSGDLKDYGKVAKSTEEVNAANAEFAENHKDGEDVGETQKMAQYMLEAMEYFDTLTSRDVHRIALEIAMVGVGGISPQKTYTIKSISNKIFNGYELLAYYYVSWARAIPHMLEKLGLPFTTAYDIAMGMYRIKKGDL